jgi:hypothetical protein
MIEPELWKIAIEHGIYLGDDFLSAESRNIIQKQIKTSHTIVSPIVVGADNKFRAWSEYTNLVVPFESFIVEFACEKGCRHGALVLTKTRHELLILTLHVSQSIKRIIVPIGFRIDLTDNGTLKGVTEDGDLPIHNLITSSHCSIAVNGVATPPKKEDLIHEASLAAAGVLEVMLNLSCRNVVTLSKPYARPTRRRFAKILGGDHNSYKYHVLAVRPAGSKSSMPAQELGVMPAHVCRGHYAYYGAALISGNPTGQDKGLLFGKLAGRFYIPNHVRGDPKNGIVDKDYKINPIKPTSTSGEAAYTP